MSTTIFRFFALCILLILPVQKVLATQETDAHTFLVKDRYEVGASFDFSSSAKTGESNFFLSPTVGYFIKDRLSINGGLSTNFSGTTSKLTGDYSLGSTYYFETKQQFAPFVYQTVSRTYGSSDSSMTGITGAGILNFLAPNVAFKTVFNYRYDFERSMNEGNFYLSGSFSIFF